VTYEWVTTFKVCWTTTAPSHAPPGDRSQQ
jgi:hypothetical protein